MVTFALVNLIDTTTDEIILRNVLISKLKNHITLYTKSYECSKSNTIRLEYAEDPLSEQQYINISSVGLIYSCLQINKNNINDFVDYKNRIDIQNLWSVFCTLTTEKLRYNKRVCKLIGKTIMLKYIFSGEHSAVILDNSYLRSIKSNYSSIMIGKEPNYNIWHCKGTYDYTQISCDEFLQYCQKNMRDIIYFSYIYQNFSIQNSNTSMHCMIDHGKNTIYNISMVLEFKKPNKPSVCLRKEFR